MKTVIICITLCKYEDSKLYIILCNNAHTSITLCKYEDSKLCIILCNNAHTSITLCKYEDSKLCKYEDSNTMYYNV